MIKNKNNSQIINDIMWHNYDNNDKENEKYIQ